ACAASRAGAARSSCAPRRPPMTALHFKQKTTPDIIYTRMTEDTHPVFASACAGAGYGIADGPHARPGIPEDTRIKTQVPAPQGVASSMPEKGRKRAGRTRSLSGTVARSCGLPGGYDEKKETRGLQYHRKTGHAGQHGETNRRPYPAARPDPRSSASH